jgi:tight adherence protein C
MNDILDSLTRYGNVVFLGAVFLSIMLVSLVVFGILNNAFDLRRRTQAIAGPSGGRPGGRAGGGIMTGAGSKHSVLDSLMVTDERSKSELRKFLALAGYEGRNAVMTYQVVRLVSAVVIGFLTVTNFDYLLKDASLPIVAAGSMLMTALGFYLPKTLVSMRRDRLCEEHRNGFPDFLDLMVICTDAGVGVDAAIERVSRDLYTAHPSLARNLRMMSLELRAGRSLREGLDNLAERLGIAEAKSFATLLQQSEELGSSLVDSLRVYGDEMRAKRYARAEEKANGLPAKLVIPLGLFIFPVILGVTLFPVALRIYAALGI